MVIGEIMTQKVHTISPNSSVKECVKILEKARVNGLIVMEGDKIVGVITKTDIFRAILPRYPENIEEERHMSDLDYIEERVNKFFEMRVKDIMSKPPITVGSGVPIIRGGSLMILRRIKQIPVVEKEKLVGIVTLSDIINKVLKRIKSR